MIAPTTCFPSAMRISSGRKILLHSQLAFASVHKYYTHQSGGAIQNSGSKVSKKLKQNYPKNSGTSSKLLHHSTVKVTSQPPHLPDTSLPLFSLRNEGVFMGMGAAADPTDLPTLPLSPCIV